MESGIYRLYSRSIAEDGSHGHQLLARFIIHNGHLQYLEEHNPEIRVMVPEGALDSRSLQRLESLQYSPYMQLVHEDDLHQGLHPDLVPQVGLDDHKPEETFDLYDTEGRHLLEIYPGCVVKDGRTLKDHEHKLLMAEIESGKAHLEHRS